MRKTPKGGKPAKPFQGVLTGLTCRKFSSSRENRACIHETEEGWSRTVPSDSHSMEVVATRVSFALGKKGAACLGSAFWALTLTI